MSWNVIRLMFPVDASSSFRLFTFLRIFISTSIFRSDKNTSSTSYRSKCISADTYVYMLAWLDQHACNGFTVADDVTTLLLRTIELSSLHKRRRGRLQYCSTVVYLE